MRQRRRRRNHRPSWRGSAATKPSRLSYKRHQLLFVRRLRLSLDRFVATLPRDDGEPSRTVNASATPQEKPPPSWRGGAATKTSTLRFREPSWGLGFQANAESMSGNRWRWSRAEILRNVLCQLSLDRFVATLPRDDGEPSRTVNASATPQEKPPPSSRGSAA